MFGKNIRVQLFYMIFVVLLFGGVTMMTSGCGSSLPGTVTLVKSVLETPVLAVSLHDSKWAYVIDENGKLITYNVAKPEAPKRESQVDAFKDESFQMVYERSSQWLVIVGKSGKIAVYDIRSPDTPLPIWGNGKVLKLKKVGPLMIRADAPTMYITPGKGTAIVRVDLASLGADTTDQAALDKATKMVSGGGGGGIVMPFAADDSAIRVYVGNQSSGKIDVWDITKIEEDFKSNKPVTSVANKAGTNVSSLSVYQKSKTANQRWLVVAASNGDLEYLDLGKNDKYADEPKSVGTASVPGLIAFGSGTKIFVGDQLSIWDFSKEFNKPIKVAEPTELSVDLVLRSVMIHKEYLLTAEPSGFNVYKYTKDPAN